jgi:hypothetical protein
MMDEQRVINSSGAGDHGFEYCVGKIMRNFMCRAKYQYPITNYFFNIRKKHRNAHGYLSNLQIYKVYGKKTNMPKMFRTRFHLHVGMHSHKT